MGWLLQVRGSGVPVITCRRPAPGRHRGSPSLDRAPSAPVPGRGAVVRPPLLVVGAPSPPRPRQSLLPHHIGPRPRTVAVDAGGGKGGAGSPPLRRWGRNEGATAAVCGGSGGRHRGSGGGGGQGHADGRGRQRGLCVGRERWCVNADSPVTLFERDADFPVRQQGEKSWRCALCESPGCRAGVCSRTPSPPAPQPRGLPRELQLWRGKTVAHSAEALPSIFTKGDR